MKIALVLLLFMPVVSFASEFRERERLADDRIAEILRAGDRQYGAEQDEKTMHGLAQRLGVSRGEIVQTSSGEWRTSDGSVFCGVSSGLGGFHIQCLAADGTVVGSRSAKAVRQRSRTHR
jgi:hypothetical protein